MNLLRFVSVRSLNLGRAACLVGSVRRSGSAVLRAIAGAPAGVRETRRGSFLVLVVGTLALMSVFAVVYIAIGRADIGTSVGVKRNAERDDVPEQVADYIARDVIAADLFSMAVDGKDSAGNPIFTRESTDGPGMSWEVTSILNPINNPAVGHTLDFNPTGTVLSSDYSVYLNTPTGQLAVRDRQLASDPWLASLTPTWLNYGGAGPTDPNKQYLDYKDWAQISNVAPDGAFVNLVNLRGNFAAPSTQMRTQLDNALLNATGNPSNTTDFGAPVRSATVNAIGKTYKVTTNPADLTLRQRGAFRLPTDMPVTFLPSDPNYTLNQWADADGDGFLDSRWFEMVDARNPLRPQGFIKTNGRHRYFFATRIVDLSGLVNVSTATDIVGKPTGDAPIGVSPADVDLRRLLTMQDFRDQFNGIAYGAIPRPTVLNGPDDYFTYDASAVGVGSSAYAALWGTGDLIAGNNVRPPLNRGAAVSGLIPPKPLNAKLGGNPFFFGSPNFWSYGDPFAKTPAASKVADRARLYRQLAANERNLSASKITPPTGTVLEDALLVSNLDNSDLLDLLAYRGLNNPEVVSNLEQIFGGRFLQGGSDRLDPLRGNRGLDVERDKLGDNNGKATKEAMALMATSVRQYITPLSGARPMVSTRLAIKNETGAANAGNAAANARLRDSLEAGELKIKISTDAASLFKGYAQALIPDAHPGVAGVQDDTWPTVAGGDATFDGLKHLHYGAKSPELGAVMSAHLAVNMAAALGSQNVSLDSKGTAIFPVKSPLAYTVLLSEEKRASLGTEKWAFPGRVLDLGKERLAAKSAQVTAPAMNVYGIVPEPVITGMGLFYVYTCTTGANKPVINGDITRTNKDFVGQVLVFQLTNPFNESIDDGSGHYIEFGGRRFNIKASDLPAGSTRSFYLLSAAPANRAKFTDAWKATQLGTDAVPILESNTSSLGVEDLVGVAGASAPAIHAKSLDTVRLWRVLDATAEHDQLVDRFRIPFEGSQKTGALEEKWNRFAAGVNVINVDPDNTIDYTGISITLATTYRRPQDPDAGVNLLESGAPAFMLERKFKGTEVPPVFKSLNRQWAARGTIGAVTDLDPEAFAPPYGEKTLAALFATQETTSVFDDAHQWLTKLPRDWNDFPIKGTDDGASYDDVRTEILRWSNVPKETKLLDAVRTGDMLMPLAIGPAFVPDKNPTPTGEDFEKQYTTLGEALALAMGYDAPQATGTSTAEKNAYKLYTDKFGGNPDTGGTGSNPAALVDRGHLRLDEFVPYDDTNKDGVFQAASEVRRGAGVPLAFNVLSVFTSHDAQLDRMVPGLVNLNTAPVPVMRTLPMLSPPDNLSLPTTNPWWLAGHDASTSDIAPAVVAYRDKVILATRKNGPAVDFKELPTVPPTQPVKFTVRKDRSAIDAIREMPGFASEGELMAVRGGASNAPADPHSIDYLGYKTGFVAPDEGVRTGDTTKNMKKSYGDRLLIANAVSNSVSVRSDVYAVWFVVAGFAKTDLVRGDGTALKPEDPMVPSVQRRFLMVVDRSNVIQKGQKPRIVLFKEVPL